MNLAIVSDVFPPKCGGSGWSSFYLAKALQMRGHVVKVVVPCESSHFGENRREYEGLEVTEFLYKAAHLPFVRNYTRNEKLYPRFGLFLADFIRKNQCELIHAQHYLTAPSSIIAAQQTGVKSVATIRDYWPVCYWTTHLSGEQICPGCSPLNRLKCLVANQGALGIIAAPASLYMASNLKLKQHWLSKADCTLAVSHYVANKLVGFVNPNRLRVIPNFVDLSRLEKIVSEPPITPIAATPYLLYVGKFEENKGTRLLLEALKEVNLPFQVLMVGDGTLRSEVEAAARQGLNLKVLGWQDNDEVLRLLHHAQALVFPSLWPEPLSRVLLEACGVGALVVAMKTGGTPDIIQSNQNGILVNDVHALANALNLILSPDKAAERLRLKQAAYDTARLKFSEGVVVEQVEKLYQELLKK